jgi:hypothetical protein
VFYGTPSCRYPPRPDLTPHVIVWLATVRPDCFPSIASTSSSTLREVYSREQLRRTFRPRF